MTDKEEISAVEMNTETEDALPPFENTVEWTMYAHSNGRKLAFKVYVPDDIEYIEAAGLIKTGKGLGSICLTERGNQYLMMIAEQIAGSGVHDRKTSLHSDEVNQTYIPGHKIDQMTWSRTQKRTGLVAV